MIGTASGQVIAVTSTGVPGSAMREPERFAPVGVVNDEQPRRMDKPIVAARLFRRQEPDKLPVHLFAYSTLEGRCALKHPRDGRQPGDLVLALLQLSYNRIVVAPPYGLPPVEQL